MAKPTVHSQVTSTAKLLRYADNILFKMTHHASLFPDPDPSLATLKAALEGFRSALAEAAFRDMRKVELKNQQQTVLKRIIYELALYVDKVCKGDPAMILAAGFLPRRGGSPTGIAPKPVDFRVSLLRINTQTVKLRVKSWSHTRVYRFEYRKVLSGEDWQMVLRSKSTCVLQRLEKLAEYEFRVAYIGTDPTITYSDVVRSYVL